MGWIKKRYSEFIENFELINSADSLEIFTDYRNKGNQVCFWAFELCGVINGDDYILIKKASGYEMLCCCQECKSFGDELFEYYTIFKALALIKDDFGDWRFNLGTSSERFVKEASDNGFERFEELYQCDFLKRLGKDLTTLLSGVILSKYNTEPIAEGAPF